MILPHLGKLFRTTQTALKGVALLAFLLVLHQPARAEDAAISPEIEKILALPEDKIDIGIAALTFAHDVSSLTDIQANSQKIDQLLEEVRTLQADAKARHVPGADGGPDDTSEALNEVLFHREDYHYDHSPDAMNNVQNLFLVGTLGSKHGICSTMPMLYMAVAQRLGLPVYAAEGPQHTFLRITDPRATYPNIEVTSGGGTKFDASYIEELHMPDAAVKRGTYLRTMTHHEYLALLLDINANYFHVHNGNADKAIKYIAQNYIHLDHDQTWTASAGAAYTFNQGTKYPTRVSVDLLVQSGLRASTPTVPNGASLPEYAVVNASIVQKLDLGLGQGTELRLDVLNIGDAVYEIRNGTGVGVGAPQFGIRRAILAGLTQRF